MNARESIEIEYAEKSKDSKGGHMVNLCRTTVRGRNTQTRWKELRFVGGKFVAWPGRWGTETVESLQQTVISGIEQNVELLNRGERLPFRDQKVPLAEYLYRDNLKLRERT